MAHPALPISTAVVALCISNPIGWAIAGASVIGVASFAVINKRRKDAAEAAEKAAKAADAAKKAAEEKAKKAEAELLAKAQELQTARTEIETLKKKLQDPPGNEDADPRLHGFKS